MGIAHTDLYPHLPSTSATTSSSTGTLLFGVAFQVRQDGCALCCLRPHSLLAGASGTMISGPTSMEEAKVRLTMAAMMATEPSLQGRRKCTLFRLAVTQGPLHPARLQLA